MGQKKKTPITVNNVEYYLEDFTDQQKIMVNHIVDLDRKLSSARFNVQQLEIGREAFINMFTRSLAEEPKTEKAA